MTDEDKSTLRILPVEPKEHVDINTLFQIPADYPRVYVLPVVFCLPLLAFTKGDLYVKQEAEGGKTEWYFRTSPAELFESYPDDNNPVQRENRSTKLQELLGVSRPSEDVFLRLRGRTEGSLSTWSETSGQKDIEVYNKGGEVLQGFLSGFLLMCSLVTPTIELFREDWLKSFYPEDDSENTTIETWQAPDPILNTYYIFAHRKSEEANSISSMLIYRAREMSGMLTHLIIRLGDKVVNTISLDEWENVAVRIDDQETMI